MEGLVCDRCGKSLLVEETVRYRVHMTIVAAYDPLELTDKDLEIDLRKQISEAIRGTEGASREELEEEVMAQRQYDLCPPCSRVVLENPFGRGT